MAATKQILNLVALVPVVLLGVGLYYTHDQHFISHSDGDIIVVTTEDTSNPSAKDFSEQIKKGAQTAQAALKRKKRSPGVRVVTQNIGELGIGPNDLMLHLARELSKGRVLGVVSGGTSYTDLSLVDLCRRLQIPLLLGVATNDDLTKRGAGVEQDVFRMPPNNRAQAKSIAYAAKAKLNSDLKLFVIVYEDNAYGNYLFTQVYHGLKDSDPTTFLVDNNTSVHILMPSIARIISNDPSVVIYIGYSKRAIDLLEELNAYNVKVPVILSDGCFSNDPDLRRFVGKLSDVSLSFPVKGAWHSGPGGEGFQAYGYVAYLLLAGLEEAQSRLGNASLTELLNGVEIPDFLTLKN